MRVHVLMRTYEDSCGHPFADPTRYTDVLGVYGNTADADKAKRRAAKAHPQDSIYVLDQVVKGRIHLGSSFSRTG